MGSNRDFAGLLDTDKAVSKLYDLSTMPSTVAQDFETGLICS